jgi:hypothetical protein
VDPIGIVGAGRVAQTLGRLLSENGRPVAAIPDTVAEAVTSRLKIPTIGIGAGPHCNGQVLVNYDILGLFDRFVPPFVKTVRSTRRRDPGRGEELRGRRSSGYVS